MIYAAFAHSLLYYLLLIVCYVQLNTTRNKGLRQGDSFSGIDLVHTSGIIQIAYNAQNLLTHACACGIVMLAPKV
jgi:hypothetical protein